MGDGMVECHSGYICISVPEQRLKELDIKMMVPENQERHKTAYTVTVDAAEGGSFSYTRCYIVSYWYPDDADSSTLCCCLRPYLNLHLPHLTGLTI